MIVLLLIAAGIVGITGIVWARHLQRLKKHDGLSREEFVAHFQTQALAPEIAGTVYDYFRRLGVWEGFMPSPSDTLEGTYKTVDEDVEESISDIVRNLGYEMPHSGIFAEWASPLITLEDVVRFVDWVRAHQLGGRRI